MLPGMLGTVEDGTLGFDCNAVLTLAQAKAFYNDGFRFVFRYISRNYPMNSYDLTAVECEVIHAAGLAIGIVQHVAREGWHATGALGKVYGDNAAKQVASLGFPKGMTVWCDLEGVNTTNPDSDAIAYATEWYNALNTDYYPGLYCGWHTDLNGTQIGNLPFRSYWSAYNLNANEFPSRGFQIRQGNESIKHGVKYDPDTASADKHGDRCWFYHPAA